MSLSEQLRSATSKFGAKDPKKDPGTCRMYPDQKSRGCSQGTVWTECNPPWNIANSVVKKCATKQEVCDAMAADDLKLFFKSGFFNPWTKWAGCKR